MLSSRLLQRVEQHWDAIARAVVEQTKHDSNTPHHRVLEDEEVRARTRDLVHNLGFWLTAGDEETVARRYREVGRTRHAEGIPLAEVVYKLHLIERKTEDFIQTENSASTSVELYGELEMLRALHRFFDLVVHNVVAGYETAAVATRAAAWSTHAHA
jgi:hypothetical protein